MRKTRYLFTQISNVPRLRGGPIPTRSASSPARLVPADQSQKEEPLNEHTIVTSPSWSISSLIDPTRISRAGYDDGDDGDVNNQSFCRPRDVGRTTRVRDYFGGDLLESISRAARPHAKLPARLSTPYKHPRAHPRAEGCPPVNPPRTPKLSSRRRRKNVDDTYSNCSPGSWLNWTVFSPVRYFLFSSLFSLQIGNESSLFFSSQLYSTTSL